MMDEADFPHPRGDIRLTFVGHQLQRGRKQRIFDSPAPGNSHFVPSSLLCWRGQQIICAVPPGHVAFGVRGLSPNSICTLQDTTKRTHNVVRTISKAMVVFLFVPLQLVLIAVASVLVIIVQCCGCKRKDAVPGMPVPGSVPSVAANNQAPRAPMVPVAGNDPNYGTLANLDKNIFAAKNSSAGKPMPMPVPMTMFSPQKTQAQMMMPSSPRTQAQMMMPSSPRTQAQMMMPSPQRPQAQQAPVAGNDPNYGTLANLDANIFANKTAAGKPSTPSPQRPQAQQAPVAGNDPNYGTLANLDANIFANKKAAGKPSTPSPQRPQAQQAAVAGNDPNYGTLANLDANIFANKKTPAPAAGGRANVTQQAPVAGNDPNYGTLANLDANIFNARR
uniref:Uncharacterized protein n=1 Tax=Globodera rostochiensis TaxID=31243 RepID=A0A914I7I2_GLORO